MNARLLSVEGALFVLFGVFAFFVFESFILNFANKIFKGHDKIIAVVEITFIVLVARKLAHWTEPVVMKVIDLIVEIVWKSVEALISG